MNQTILAFFMVALGGALGSCTRYGLSIALRAHAAYLPMGTVVANIAGSFIIGMIAGSDLRLPGLSPQLRLLLATGCGH